MLILGNLIKGPQGLVMFHDLSNHIGIIFLPLLKDGSLIVLLFDKPSYMSWIVAERHLLLSVSGQHLVQIEPCLIFERLLFLGFCEVEHCHELLSSIFLRRLML